MAALAESLSRLQSGRSVIDKTGLPGTYDLHLKWTADPMRPETPGNPGVFPAVDDFSEPVLFTAVREQLGLRIESAKGPVEVVVIDHAEGQQKISSDATRKLRFWKVFKPNLSAMGRVASM